VSLSAEPVSRFMSHANTTTPARRTWSLVSSTPSLLEATTKSASPSTRGSSITGSSAGSFWPSASKVTTKRAPPSMARR